MDSSQLLLSDSDDPNSELSVEPPTAAKSIIPPAKPGVGSLVVAGSFWLLVQTIGSKAIMLGGQLVLAWLLSPEDFGLIGLAYSVLAFVTLLINPGIDVILVRRGRRIHLWSTPAFYFSLIAGLSGCAVMLTAAPLVARFYGSPQIVGLLSVLALATPIGSLMLVPTAKLRSEMRFGVLSAVNFLQSFVQTVLTLMFAAANFGVYSFVLPMPIVYALMSVVLWAIAKPRLRWRHPLQYWRHLIGDSAYIFGQRLLVTAVAQGDYVVLGALLGAAVVGPYFFAFGIAVQAIRLTAGPMQLVLMAGLTRLESFSHQQTHAALRVTKSLVLFGMPLCMLQAVVARPFLVGMYSDKWVEAVPLAQLISIGMAFDVATWTACSLIQSRGQFRLLFVLSSILAPTFFAFIVVGALVGGSLGVAFALCVYYLMCAPSLVAWVFRDSHVGWDDIVGIFAGPLVVGLLTSGGALLTIRLTEAAGIPQLVQCGFAGSAGLIIMGISASLIAPSTWTDLMTRLKNLDAPLLLARRRTEN